MLDNNQLEVLCGLWPTHIYTVMLITHILCSIQWYELFGWNFGHWILHCMPHTVSSHFKSKLCADEHGGASMRKAPEWLSSSGSSMLNQETSWCESFPSSGSSLFFPPISPHQVGYFKLFWEFRGLQKMFFFSSRKKTHLNKWALYQFSKHLSVEIVMYKKKKILAFGSNILGIDTPLSILASAARPSLMC